MKLDLTKDRQNVFDNRTLMEGNSKILKRKKERTQRGELRSRVLK